MSSPEQLPANNTPILYVKDFFTKLVNTTVYTWCESNNKCYKGQAGFWQNHNVIDNIYILHKFVNKYLKDGMRIDCAFADFSKEY